MSHHNRVSDASGMYYITGGSEGYWVAIHAATLRGAKVLASRRYQSSLGGTYRVGEKVQYANGDGEYRTIAVNRSGVWVDAY